MLDKNLLERWKRDLLLIELALFGDQIRIFFQIGILKLELMMLWVNMHEFDSKINSASNLCSKNRIWLWINI